MNNKDKIEHIMALHNGELGVTWEGHDVVTPDTIAKLDQLIQDERKEAVEEALRDLRLVCDPGKPNNMSKKDYRDYLVSRGAPNAFWVDEIDSRLAELTKGGSTDDK